MQPVVKLVLIPGHRRMQDSRAQSEQDSRRRLCYSWGGRSALLAKIISTRPRGERGCPDSRREPSCRW